ncbi:MAG: peptidase M16 [Alphaproteobacteria bacterium]|nr:peptidase M16 [Alphaproteobacteria bacterium]
MSTDSPSSFTLSTLPNGFRIASEVVAAAETVAFAISVGVGARYETLEEHGISHLLEHMAFKGTPTHNARELAEAFDLMGGNVNAYTGSETTVYYCKVLKEYAADALRLLCSIVRHSTIDEAELERERGVILQELAMHHDTPDDRVFDLMQETAYPAQAMGRSILGTEASIARHPREAILHFIAQHYVPRRMVLSAAGAVDHTMLVAIGEQFFGDIPDAAVSTCEPAQYQGGTHIMYKKLEQVQFTLGYRACASTDPDYYALQVFTTLLGGGMSSRLFQEIREKRGLVYSVSAFASCYQDTGMLGIYAATGPEHMGELMPALADVLTHAGEQLSEQELLRAKNQLKANIVMARESIGSIAEWIGRHLLMHDRVKTAAEILGVIDALTLADMQRIARSTIGASPLTLATLGPIKTLSSAALPQAA